MAWGTHAERRAAVESSALKAEARAQDHRAREANYRVQGKAEKAEKHAATAARQERIALGHRQEIDRLAARARQEGADLLTTAQRAHMMARAQERAETAAALQPPVDPLVAFTEALQTATTMEEEAERREKNARGYERAGAAEKARIALVGADRARRRAADWRAEAERIQGTTSRDLRRELKLAVKAQRRLESQAKNEGKRRTDLGVVSDPRTAAGQREIASGGKGRGVAVASLRDYASLIRKPQERTRIRLETMERFDTLCAKADSSLFPEPKFEHESGSGHGPGALVMAARAAGLAELAEISAGLGARNVEMLRAWIYERSTLIALIRAGYGTERNMGARTLAVLDALTAFFKTGNPLDAAVAGMGLAARPQPAAKASAEAESPPPPKSEGETANFRSARAGRNRPAEPQPWSNHLPAGDKPARSTIACSAPISDDARDTIQALGTYRGQV